MGYLALMRPLVCLSAAGATFAGLVAVGFPFAAPRGAVLTIVSVFLLMGAADAFNDYFDRDIDRLNAPARPIPSRRVSPPGALAFAALLFTAGNAAAWGTGPAAAAGAAALSALYVMYGVWSKKLGLVKNLLIGLTGSASLIMAALALGRANGVLGAMALHAFLMMLAVEIAKDIEDMEGDAACGARTWALAVGVARARRAALAAACGGLVVLAAAGATGMARGWIWPSLAAASGLVLAPFLVRLHVRTPLLILAAAALGMAGLALGSL